MTKNKGNNKIRYASLEHLYSSNLGSQYPNNNPMLPQFNYGGTMYANGGPVDGITPGMKLGSGIGAAADIGSGLLDMLATEQHQRVNKGQMTGQGALSGAKFGAQVGGMFGPLGAGIGAGLGAIGGGIYGNIQGSKAEEENASNLRDYYYGTGQNNRAGWQDNAPTFANGGTLPTFSAGNMDMTMFEGNSHEQGGIQIGGSEVEGGEVRVDDYIFSDRLKSIKGKTFADEAKRINNKYKERTNDAPTERSKKKELTSLMQDNESARIMEEQIQADPNAVNNIQDVKDFGDSIEFRNGGVHIKSSKRGELTKLAKERNMGVNALATLINSNRDMYSKDSIKLAYGGRMPKMKHDGGKLPMYAGGGTMYQDGGPDDPYKIKTSPGFEVPQQGLSDFGFEDLDQFRSFYNQYIDEDFDWEDTKFWGDRHQSAYNSLADHFADNPSDRPGASPNIDPSQLPGLETPTFSGPDPSNMLPGFDAAANETTLDDTDKNKNTGKNKFGRPEAALLTTSGANIGKALRALKPETVQYQTYTPEKISLEGQRQVARRQTSIGRAISRQNARASGRSSGEALSNLATTNAALTENLVQSDLQSFMKEGNINTQIENRARQYNTQIMNQSILANEQNRGMAQTVFDQATSDQAHAVQGYMKDKGMIAENERYNNQIVGLINQMFPNYSWGEDPEKDNKLMLQFRTSLQGASLPK